MESLALRIQDARPDILLPPHLLNGDPIPTQAPLQPQHIGILSFSTNTL